MLRSWLEQIQLENQITDTTMRSIKCILDRLFDFLIEKEVISDSPLKEIFYKKTSPQAITRNHLPPQEIDRLLEAVKRYSPGYLYPIIKLFAETGAKVTEVANLKWTEVNCTKRTIEFKGTERSQSRTLPISEELATILSRNQKTNGFVFKTYYREPFTPMKITLATNDFKRKDLYKRDWTLLDLRHSFGTNFLLSGSTLNELQVLMGHGNVFETKRIYGTQEKSTDRG